MQPLRDSSGRGDMDSSIRSTSSGGNSSSNGRRISTPQAAAAVVSNNYGPAINNAALGMQHPSSFPGSPSAAGYSLPGQPLAAPPNAQQQQQRLFQMQQIQQHQMQLQQLQQQQRQRQQQQQQQQLQQQQRQKNQQQQQSQQQSRQSSYPQQDPTSSQRRGSGGSHSSLHSQTPSTSSMNPQNSSHRSTNGPTIPHTADRPPPVNNNNNNNRFSDSPTQQQQQLQQHSHQQPQHHQQNLQNKPAAPTQNSFSRPKPPPPTATATTKTTTATASSPIMIPPPTAAVSRTSTASSAAAAGAVAAASSTKASSSSHHNQNPNSSAAAPLSEEETAALLAKCDWRDRTMWVSRQLFGGQSLNGFLRSTATVQRIKKQRARQTKESSKKADSANNNKADDASAASSSKGSGAVTGTAAAAAANKKRIADPDQAAEEEIKHKVMNARTAKKMKSELDVGVSFCEILHGAVRGILADMADTGIQVPPPLGKELPGVPRPPNFPQVAAAASTAKAASAASTQKAPPATTTKKPPPSAPPAKPAPSPMARPAVSSTSSQQQQSTISAGNPNGSTLRKHRKKKLPPNAEPAVNLPEFESNGKRICTKKEHMLRVFQIMRFRSLRQGDHVAARVSSRDLWILARVVKDFPGVTLPPAEFLRLSDTRRDQLFRDKVMIKDVEDKESGATPVARNLILPLPRTFSEAAEWGQNYKKGSRVYAMYPQTTSLYTATVMDNTTYCRDDDDIIVVEFDGDEADETGSIPRCHIPARFVTLIPREFPGAQAQNKKRRPSLESPPSNAKTSKATSSAATAPPPKAAAAPEMEDPLNALGEMPFDDMPALGDFDELDFDLGFTG